MSRFTNKIIDIKYADGKWQHNTILNKCKNFSYKIRINIYENKTLKHYE